MKNKAIKTAAVLAVLSLALALFPSAANVTAFSDVPSEFWGYKTIMDMTEKGIFKGTEEPVNGIGVFSPDKIMTRAEFITASLRAMFPEEAKDIAVDPAQWWKGYYTFAIDKGIIKSSELGGGELEKAMTRQEMAMVMVRCVTQNGEKLSQRVLISQIPDYSKIGDYYADYVRDCFSFGLLCGVDEAGTFAPAKSLTRAEAATVICRLLDKDMRIEVKFIKEPTQNNKPQVSDKDDKDDKDDKTDTEKMPWESGGKHPSKYTWEEFDALTDLQKNAFIESFGSADAFDSWLSKVQGTEEDADKLPWESGGKQPSEYTWEEFEALPDTQKDAFIQSFGSADAFDKWLKKAQRTEGDADKLPWENGGKQPFEYTLEEFEALPDLQKDAFIESFGSVESFDKWLKKAQGTEGNVDKLPWENGGKQPAEYTLEEFEALTNVQKEAFVNYFDSSEAFEAWLNSNQP